MGAVGREVARLATAFGAKVLAYDPLAPRAGATEAAVQRVDLATVFAESDIVSLHCPAPADGRPMIGARELATFRRGAVLVNTARAALVDEAALLMALQSGQVDVYATDVYPQEPPRDLALFRHDRVIAVSHIGGYTRESVERATTAAVANLLEALASAP
jgi:phosphoglycerate dehydrogenase-like enzyme